MKTLKTVVFLLLATFSLQAQDLRTSEVPNKVKSAFEKAYSKATDVEWEKEGQKYQVEFDLDRYEHEIWYDESGKMLKMEKDISSSDLPKAVSATIEKDYAAYRIDECELRKDGNKTTYKVELEKNGHDFGVLFDEAGEILQKWGDD